MAKGKRIKRGKAKSAKTGTMPPTLRIKRPTYNPTKAELEEEIHIPTTPEKLAKILGRKVNIEYED